MKNLIKAIAVVIAWMVTIILSMLPVIGVMLLVGWITNDVVAVCVAALIVEAVMYVLQHQ